VQFLDNGDGVRFPLILNWLAKMKRIEKWFEVCTTALLRASALAARYINRVYLLFCVPSAIKEQSLFHFYSSSILLIYEGSAPKDCTDQQVLKADVRMVSTNSRAPLLPL